MAARRHRKNMEDQPPKGAKGPTWSERECMYMLHKVKDQAGICPTNAKKFTGKGVKWDELTETVTLLAAHWWWGKTSKQATVISHLMHLMPSLEVLIV